MSETVGMGQSRRRLTIVLCGALIIAGSFAREAAPALARPAAAAALTSHDSAPRIRLAVLGDSDSESYDHARGGAWRANTWQWTEVLAQLRGDQLDLGEWRAWGTGKYRAYIGEAIGLPARTPAKRDYRYDFAVNGATCGQLMGRSQRQARRLVELMDTERDAWRGGVVLIRIGVNDIGAHDVLDELARDRHAAGPNALIDSCIGEIGKAVALIRARHRDTYVVLVGVLNNADWSGEFDHWQSADAMANIDAGLNRFDNGLRKLAAADSHVYFLDDRAWFRSLWGTRDDEGRPRYKSVRLSPGWEITNTSGDDPHNAVLSDSHAGVVWNTLWAQHLIASLNAAFGLRLTPITDAQVVRFLAPAFEPSRDAKAAPRHTPA